MKKVLLFFSMVLLSMNVMFAQDYTDGWKTAKDFNWDAEKNEQVQQPGTDVWWRVQLKGKVADGENVLLYLNNLDETNAANVEVTVYNVVFKTIAGKEQASVGKLTGPESKAISPNKNYALEIGGSVIKNFNLDTVYIMLSTNRKISFAAEPVEPGEKDLDCLNATELSLNSSFTYSKLNSAVWYKINLKSVKDDPSKAVEVKVTNVGGASATVKAGVSFDCPSTGITEETRTLAADASKTKKLDRSYLDLLASDEVYFRVISDQKVKVEANVVASTEVPDCGTVNKVGIINLDLETKYNLAANVEQWYVVDLKKVGVKRQLPEVVVENLGDATADIKAFSVYSVSYCSSMDRSFKLAKGAVKVQDVQRNVVDNAIKVARTQNDDPAISSKDTGVVYVRVLSSQPISFMARAKAISEGNACASAKLFDWTNGNMQAANTTVWYAVSIKQAKADNNSDIKLTITNKSSKTANVDAKVAFECPYTSTTDKSLTIAANDKKSGTLNNSMYKHLKNDTIFVGLTTTQNIEFRADLVPMSADLTTDEGCQNAIAFDPEGEGVQITMIKGGSLVALDTVWYSVDLDKVRANEQVPQIHVRNNGTKTANVRVDGSLDCPAIVSQLQGRSITVSPSKPYVQTPSTDALKSISEDVHVAYVRVITDQPLDIWAEMVYEDEGSSCAKAAEFNWTLGEEYTPAEPKWYKVAIKEAKDGQKNIRMTLKNTSSKDAKVTAEISFGCNDGAPTVYSYTSKAGETKSKVLTYSMFEKVTSDTVFVKITSEASLKITAALEEDLSPVIDICSKGPKEYDWNNGEYIFTANLDNLTDTTWFYLPLDTFEKENYLYVPKVILANQTATKANLKGIVAFSCQTKSPMTRTMTLNEYYEKLAERSMVKQYTNPDTKDTAYFGIVTDQDIYFRIQLVNPDQGQDCQHAVSFDWVKGNKQAANDTVWYDVDLTMVKNQKNPPVSATIGLQNLDGFTGMVYADLFFSCEDAEPFASFSYNLQANDIKERELGREMFTNMAVDHIFIRLYTIQECYLYAKLNELDDTFEPIEACHGAVPVTFNVDIDQSQDSVWYVVDLKDIRDNILPKTDATQAVLKVTNKDAADANIKAHVSYSCPVDEKMLERQITLAPGALYQKEVATSVIKNTTADSVWVLVVTDKKMSFRVELEDPRGQECGNPIEFDWEHGNLHPADSTYWYRVDLTPFKNDPKQRDMKLVLVNLTDPRSSVTATAHLFAQCPVDGTTTEQAAQLADPKTYTFSDSIKSKEITRSFIESYNLEFMLIKYFSDENTRIVAEFIKPLERHKDTVCYYDTICAGDTYYRDSLKLTQILYADTIIHRTEGAVLDSIEYEYNDTELADSLIYHIVTIKKNPVLPKFSELKNKFVDSQTFKAGTVFDFAPYIQEITDTLAQRDDILTLDVDSVFFQFYNEDNGKFDQPVPTDPYPIDKEDITFRYAVRVISCAGMDTIIGDTVGIPTPLKLAECDYLETVITGQGVCSGFKFTDLFNVEYTVDEAYEIVKDTLPKQVGNQIFKEVTVYNYSLLQTPAAVVPTALPTASCGKGVDVAAAAAELATAFPHVDGYADVDLTTLAWEYDNNGTYEPLTATTYFNTDVKTINVRYTLNTECDVQIVSDPIVVTVADDCTVVEKAETDTVCAGTEFQTRLQTLTITADAQVADTVNFQTEEGYYADSVYTYNIYVYKNLVAPTFDDLTALPVAVCGELVDVADVDAELQALLAAQTADPIVEQLAATNAVVWEVQVNGAWVAVDSYNISSTLTSIDVRFTINTECGNQYSDVITLDKIEKRTPENIATLQTIPADVRYGGYIILVSKTILNQNGITDSTLVKWYKVQGLKDTESDETDDIFLGTGWYYTEQNADGTAKRLEGNYYAKIETIETTDTDGCVEIVYSKTITVEYTSAAPKLVPNMVAPNETITLSGLDAAKTYTVSVYDLMGNLFQRFSVQDKQTVTFEAEINPGYYMVSVEDNDGQTALKYIVK